ncbi:hypothetical protein, partial [Nocardia vulneris]
HPTPLALAKYIAAELVPAEAVVDRIVAQADLLSGLCSGAELDRAEIAVVAERLSAIVRSLRGGGTEVDLAAADDDELFEFIDSVPPAHQ